jgi:hypothetical protein
MLCLGIGLDVSNSFICWRQYLTVFRCQYLFYHSKYSDIYANKTEWTTFADESLKQYTNFIRPVYVHCEICFIPIHLYF